MDDIVLALVTTWNTAYPTHYAAWKHHRPIYSAFATPRAHLASQLIVPRIVVIFCAITYSRKAELHLGKENRGPVESAIPNDRKRPAGC